jgi:hypothetical protein
MNHFFEPSLLIPYNQRFAKLKSELDARWGKALSSDRVGLYARDLEKNLAIVYQFFFQINIDPKTLISAIIRNDSFLVAILAGHQLFTKIPDSDIREILCSISASLEAVFRISGHPTHFARADILRAYVLALAIRNDMLKIDPLMSAQYSNVKQEGFYAELVECQTIGEVAMILKGLKTGSGR